MFSDPTVLSLKAPKGTQSLTTDSGLFHGFVQATFTTLLICVLNGHRASPWLVVAVIAVIAFIGLGAWIDMRRRHRELRLSAPRRIRAGLAAAVAMTTAFALLSRLSGTEALCSLVTLVPVVTLILDRILGPLWVVIRLARISSSRRQWSCVVVLKVEDASLTVETEDRRHLVARSEWALPHGPIYVQFDYDRMLDSPYRSLEQVRISTFETVDERRGRKHDTWTPSVGFVAGLAWLAVPFLGFALNQ